MKKNLSSLTAGILATGLMTGTVLRQTQKRKVMRT